MNTVILYGFVILHCYQIVNMKRHDEFIAFAVVFLYSKLFFRTNSFCTRLATSIMLTNFPITLLLFLSRINSTWWVFPYVIQRKTLPSLFLTPNFDFSSLLKVVLDCRIRTRLIGVLPSLCSTVMPSAKACFGLS